MGRIHPDAEKVYFSSPQREAFRQVLQPFLTCFDVTRAFSHTRGGDRLECFYLKGEPFIAELIGLERELLLAYAPFESFQARTLKLHDDVLAADRTRLDPVGSVLISDDADTSKAILEFLSGEPERPPIIGLSAQDLRRIAGANELRALFVERLFRRDLFALESPLRTDTTFFGRADLVTQLLDRFRGGQNSGLFGLRRIGKTSVLYAVSRRASAGGIAGSLYVDASSPGLYQLRWWELLQRMVTEAAGPLDLQRAERSRVRALSTQYEPRTAAGHFKTDLLSLSDKLPGRRLLLLLDEIEHVTFDISPMAHWADDFLPLWQTIRSVHQDTKGQFGFIVAGVNPHITEADRVKSFDNPLFSTTKPFYVAPFDRAATREMVRRVGKYMGLRCEEALYQLLWEEYGGHPFLVRQACSALARQLPDRPAEITCALFERERASIALQLERNVRQVLNVLAIWYPGEYEMVSFLAQGDRKTFVEFANHSAEFTQHVEGYGLVREARSNPQLSMGLVRDHLARQVAHVPAPANADLESVLAEISRRRNRIELAMRQLLRDGLRFAEGQKAMHTALQALKEDRRAVLSQYSYGDVWQELYFDELASILDRNFGAFQKRMAVEKETVIGWMKHVNRCRADAHARTLSPDDRAHLGVCFRRLEELLEIRA